MRLMLIFLFLMPLIGFSQQPLWNPVNEKAIVFSEQAKLLDVFPKSYTSYELHINALKDQLAALSSENNQTTISFPLPNGKMENFKVWETKVMQPALADRFTDIRTFAGKSLEHPEMSIHFDYSPFGFHASIISAQGKIYLWPMAENQDKFYISFYLKDFPIEELGLSSLTCGNDEVGQEIKDLLYENGESVPAIDRSLENESVQLREYVIAMACAGEYGQAKGGSVASVLSTFVTAINTLNQVLEVDAGIRLILVGNTDNLIYLNPATDPYATPDDLGTVLAVNPNLFTTSINTNTFDIGHTFTNSCPGGGTVGLAARPSVCNNNLTGQHKSRGATCHFNSNVTFITLEVFSHEVGHQFAANHSFNNCPGNETNVNIGTGYEPGSGSTIMSYSGACGGGNNIQGSSDPYFNSGALEEMFFYTRSGLGDGCPTKIDLGNHDPSVELPYPTSFTIPIGTPFELEAIASDIDGDALTYCWEQYNVGPTSQLGFPVGNAPAFRSFPPVNVPNRIFPSMDLIVNNTTSIREVLPEYSRNFTFTCTVRDNFAGGGGTVIKEVSFKASEQAGPFLVTHPNTNTSWKVGDYTEVTWDVANTDSAPVNCQKVNIRLSTDGGYTYPYTLLENVYNSGSAFITVPDLVTNQARVRVEGAGNIFFDISNTNFSIIPADQPGYSMTITPYNLEICTPNEAQVAINTTSLLGYDSLVSLTVVGGLPEGTDVSFSDNPFLPSNGTEMILTFGDVPTSGLYALTLEATAPDLPATQRTIFLDLIYNNFDAFGLTSPEDGSSGVSFLPQFAWKGLPHATYYQFELANNPSFDSVSIVDAVYELTDTTYTASKTLEAGTTYYWRVRPGNECRAADWPSLPYAFNTIAYSCSKYQAFDLPQVIPGSGLPTIESKINIPNSGAISDLNISTLTGVHKSLQYIKVSLVSPSNTERILFSNFPCTSSNFNNISFDDEAPGSLSCPPATGGKYQPKQSFEVFKTEDPAGIWTLKAEVTSNAGDGGYIDAFELEICSDVNLNGPVLVTNDLLAVRPGSPRAISDTFLLVEDTDNTPFELVYTLVKLPEHGTLVNKNQPLELGQQYNQNNVNQDVFYYLHNGDTNTDDSFYFTVNDGDGGWIGITRFDIVMDEDAPVLSIAEPEESQAFSIFPNPANDWIDIKFEEPLDMESHLELYDASGKLVQKGLLQRGQLQFNLSINDISAGMYWLHIRNKKGTSSQKLVVKK